MPNRTIAIGDIHGCDVALMALLQLIQPTEEDLVIQLGDVIDRGPNSSRVIEQLLSLREQCELVVVRGNHEEMLLDAIADSTKIKRWLGNGGTQTVKSYGRRTGMRTDLQSIFPGSHYRFLLDTIPYFETRNAIFLHAGYVAHLPLNEQPDLALRWRITSEANAEPHCSGKTVYVGHTPQRSGDMLDLDFVKCIDTNCYRGGWLTAVDVETNEFWQANNAGHTRSKRQ